MIEINIGRIQILQLMCMSNVQTKRLDEAINLFQILLIDTNLHLKYKHLNKFYYTDSNWLKLLATRYRKEEWIEFSVGKHSIWPLRALILNQYEHQYLATVSIS